MKITSYFAYTFLLNYIVQVVSLEKSMETENAFPKEYLFALVLSYFQFNLFFE